MTTCEFCHEDLEVELLEYWPDERAFLLNTCCEERYENARGWLDDALAGDQDARRAFARWFGDESGVAVRGVFDDYGTAKLDWGLALQPITRDAAKAFVAAHHRHRGPGQPAHRPPVSWRWGHAVANGPDLVGVAMVGRPVARRLDPTTIVEVTRCCTRDDLAPALVKDACSMLYAAAAREATRKGYRRAITYVLETEHGAALRAAGWTPVARTRGGSWNRPSRDRIDVGPTCPKIRWERRLAA